MDVFDTHMKEANQVSRQRDDVHTTTARLLAMTYAERRALPYMHPGRADVIGAGALIWSRILARVPVPEHVVSEADILHGIAAAIAR